MTASSGAASYRPLPKVCKGRYPFSLSVPSFIYPDTWSENARMLGPHVDEIELLFFESQTKDCLPSRQEIDALSRISKEFSLEYNIHLPTDVSLAAAGRAGQAGAVDALKRVVDLTSRLDPTSWTLHVPCDVPRRTEADVARWQERARAGLGRLVSAGMPPRRIAIENIDYPFGWARDFVRDLDLSVCMDIGHLLLRGENISDFYRENADRIAIVHLHGVGDGKDHLPLTALSEPDGTAAGSILEAFTGTLSVEVFSYEHLAVSLEWVETALNGAKSGS